MPHFIAHIDEANQRINALESQLGLTHSAFLDNLDDANARIQELEGKQAAPSPAAAANSPGELATLNERCRWLANCLGFQEYGNYTTVPAARLRVADLERRVQQNAQSHEKQQPAKPAPKPLPNDLAAIEKSGKVSGLGKAMIAATKQHNQQAHAK